VDEDKKEVRNFIDTALVGGRSAVIEAQHQQAAQLPLMRCGGSCIHVDDNVW
jgi:hypothetical protein